MIRWFLSTLTVAIVVAALMILYLSPDLRSKALNWFKQKNVLVEKRVSQLKNKIPDKTDLEKAKDIILKKDETKPTESSKDTKPSQTTIGSKKPPLQDNISENDRKELEKVLEKASK